MTVEVEGAALTDPLPFLIPGLKLIWTSRNRFNADKDISG